ncbi:MAG: NADH-quinone oxidoreductase subunit J [Planctomycetes bacterium]|nr:NADH-quinone oxidoreductase subunit J [Planctomycetota bacterium]
MSTRRARAMDGFTRPARLATRAFAVIAAIGASSALGADAAAKGVTSAAAPGGLLEAFLFYGVALATVVSAVGVCFSRNIVRMAVWLFLALGSVSMVYFMLAANFLGAIQLIVYAGGTLVLLVFGVMLTSKSPWVKFECGKAELALAAVICATLLGCLCLVLGRTTWAGVTEMVPGASVAAIGERLLTTYLVPFEVAGVLLMIVMVGAAHLARQEQ